LWAAIALSLVLQIAVVHLPLLNDAFDTTGLSLAQWGVCAALGATVLVTGEAYKAVLRAHAR
jgi:P-type Ca2+ transporter type 2C